MGSLRGGPYLFPTYFRLTMTNNEEFLPLLIALSSTTLSQFNFSISDHLPRPLVSLQNTPLIFSQHSPLHLTFQSSSFSFASSLITTLPPYCPPTAVQLPPSISNSTNLLSTLFSPAKSDRFFVIPPTAPNSDRTLFFQQYLQTRVSKVSRLQHRG